MELVLPSVEFKDSFIEAVKEFHADPDDSHRNQWYRKLAVSELESDFESFVEEERSHSRGENLPEGYVPYSTFWMVDNAEFIGQTNIRHRLNDQLERIGGHLGYDVRPSKRRRGYGKKILELALAKATELGIQHVLITCDAGNEPSQKIIERSGGVLENQVPNAETGIDKRRYWVDIK